RDRPRRVDTLGEGVAATWDVERGDGTVPRTQEAGGGPKARVYVKSRNRHRRVNAEGQGLEATSDIERKERMLLSQDEGDQQRGKHDDHAHWYRYSGFHNLLLSREPTKGPRC